MRLIQLSQQTVARLKELQSRPTFIIDRLTKDNKIEVSEELYRQLQRLTPVGRSLDSTIQLLIYRGLPK